MKWEKLSKTKRETDRETKGERITLSFGSSIHATAVATLVRDRALDPKVQGSNPEAAED